MENKEKNKLAKLVVTTSPHIYKGETISEIMYMVIIALIPAIIASYLFFGIKSLQMIAVSVITAVVLETIILFLRKKPIAITDGSAIITGILLAFNLSPEVPLLVVVVGCAVAMLIGKHAFGGLGNNIFNPALVGRAFLLAAYPTYMTSWSLNGVTGATPLAVVKENLAGNIPVYMDMFIGKMGGCIGETSALALLIGGAFLLYKKVISWHIPATYIGTVFILMFLLGKDPVFHILAGGILLGAIFMATDMVTSPSTPMGMIVFGIGCGIATTIIRLFGKYPEGVSYSILFMNACTPLIDRYTMPKIFGTKKKLHKVV